MMRGTMISRGGFAVVLLASLVWGSAGGAFAQENVISLALQGNVEKNPYASDADVEAGAKIFRASCAICHGGDATGGRGPNLTRGTYRHGSSDRALFKNILTGIPRTGMPGIYRPDRDIWQAVTYIRSLSKNRKEIQLSGDPKRGRRLYLTRGSCSECHRINGEGGRLGPDLTNIGWIRSPEHLKTSLLKSSESVEDNYRTVRVATSDDIEVEGVLLNEDTYSIQLMDNLENLRSFMKSDVKTIVKPDVSLMPDFEGFFSPGELNDFVAYLYSLRGEGDES